MYVYQNPQSARITSLPSKISSGVHQSIPTLTHKQIHLCINLSLTAVIKRIIQFITCQFHHKCIIFSISAGYTRINSLERTVI